MLNYQIIINITPETAEKFASLSPEKQSQLKLLLGLELQELISPKNPKDSPNLTISQNTQYRGLTEEIFGYILEGDYFKKSSSFTNRPIF